MTISNFVSHLLICSYVLKFRATPDIKFDFKDLKSKSTDELLVESKRLRNLSTQLELTADIRNATSKHKFLGFVREKIGMIMNGRVRELSGDDETEAFVPSMEKTEDPSSSSTHPSINLTEEASSSTDIAPIEPTKAMGNIFGGFMFGR